MLIAREPISKGNSQSPQHVTDAVHERPNALSSRIRTVTLLMIVSLPCAGFATNGTSPANGIFLPVSRQMKILDTRFGKHHDVWKTCKLYSVHCSLGLIIRQVCFWPSSGSVFRSSILLSLYALVLSISTRHHHISRANITKLSPSLLGRNMACQQ